MFAFSLRVQKMRLKKCNAKIANFPSVLRELPQTCSRTTGSMFAASRSCLRYYQYLRVEFLLETDSGYPKDTGVNKPWQPLGIPFAIAPIGQLHQSPPSPIPGDLGRGPSHQSTSSNIETRMDRPKSVVRVIRGVA